MTATQSGPTKHAVRAALAAGLGAALGRPVTIASLQSAPLASRSTYPIDRLHLTFDTGEQRNIIFKRFVPNIELKDGQREILIYERLLRGRRFGAPAVYGSVYDDARDRYWLFLEDVGERTLRHADSDVWMAATRWLAEMHATCAGEEGVLRALDCLDVHGSAYYHAIALRARENVRSTAASTALTRLDRCMDRFDEVVRYLAEQPRTLVHGDIFSWNIMVQRGPTIRPVDWEAAAIGLGVWDLVRLFDGWGAAKQPYVDAYMADLGRFGRPVGDSDAFARCFRSCQLVNALWHLGWSAEQCRDATFVDGYIAKLENGVQSWTEGTRDG